MAFSVSSFRLHFPIMNISHKGTEAQRRKVYVMKLTRLSFPTFILLGVAMTMSSCVPPSKTAPADAAAKAPAKLKVQVDPGVRGRRPSITVQPGDSTYPYVLTIRDLDAPADAPPLVQEVLDLGKTSRRTMPAVTKDTFVDVTLTTEVLKSASAAKSDDNSSLPAVPWRWRTLLRPRGQKMLDYTGHGEELPMPADFDAYWQRARSELDAVPMTPVITRVTEKDSKTGLLHRVELPTVGDTRIVCWYFVPRAAFDASGKAIAKFPAIVIAPGYGAEEPPLDRTAEGFITLSINPHNHGPSREFWISPVEHMTYNMTDPEHYYYKLAFLDVLRGVQFIFSRPEVDTARVASEGGSQGGIFALAAAMLEPRIACACSNVTAFSAYPEGMKLAQIGHHTQFRGILKNASAEDRAKIMQ